MQLYDVCTKRNYEVEGEKKVKWYKAGFMKTTDKGNSYIRLYNQPDIDFHVFPRETELPEIQTKE